MAKLVVRLKGGLGNQLFEFAAGFRLAHVNGAELVLDSVSGFSRDRQYRRQFALNDFAQSARLATPAERLEPLERYRRGWHMWRSRRQDFVARSYLEQEGIAFDPRLLDLRFSGTVYLDGLWQSEQYFADVAGLIRSELEIVSPMDRLNKQTLAAITEKSSSVAVHYRDFDASATSRGNNVGRDYYDKAFSEMLSRLDSPHFFVFTDSLVDPPLPSEVDPRAVTRIRANSPTSGAVEDLRLIRSCRHFITANSTFSWWGAWLGTRPNSIVTTPRFEASGTVTAWNFDGLIPRGWLIL